MLDNNVSTTPDGSKVNGKFNYTIVSMLFLGWLIGGFDRMVMNFSAVPITKEFGLTATQTGMLISSFLLSFLIMQIPGGWFADKFGPRKVLLSLVFVWSIFTIFTGIAWGFVALLVIRFGFGIGEGPFSSACIKMINMEYPRKFQGKALSLVLVSSGIVSVTAPLFAAKVIAAVGWRPLFLGLGVFGAVIAYLWFKFLPKSTTDKAGGENAPTTNAVAKEKITYGQMLKVPMVWSLLIANLGTYSLMWGINGWMPSYLVKVGGLNLVSAGWAMSIPGIASLLAFLFAGTIVDHLKPQQSKLAAICAALISAALFYLMYTGLTVYQSIACITVINFFFGFLAIYIPVVMMKNLPTEIMGSANGFVMFGGQIGSFVTPIIMGMLVDAFKGNFSMAFWYLMAVSIVMMVALVTLKSNTTEHFAAE